MDSTGNTKLIAIFKTAFKILADSFLWIWEVLDYPHKDIPGIKVKSILLARSIAVYILIVFGIIMIFGK